MSEALTNGAVAAPSSVDMMLDELFAWNKAEFLEVLARYNKDNVANCNII